MIFSTATRALYWRQRSYRYWLGAEGVGRPLGAAMAMSLVGVVVVMVMAFVRVVVLIKGMTAL